MLDYYDNDDENDDNNYIKCQKMTIVMMTMTMIMLLVAMVNIATVIMKS